MANRWLARRGPRSNPAVVRGRRNGLALTASAMSIDLTDRSAVKTMTDLQQPWQAEAWAYRRNVGELRYADTYLANSCGRLRLHPAAYAPGNPEPSELTVENCAEFGIPADLAQAATDVMERLASGGPTGMAQLQRRLTSSFEMAGEGYLLGRTSPLTPGEEDWSIRSTSEIRPQRDGSVYLAENPTAMNLSDMERLNPALDTVQRLWWPDPQWAMMADSPVRSALDTLEELLLLSKDVRATARSRIANNGILFIPESLSVTGPEPEADDDEADPFTAALMEAGTVAMSNEGSAAAVMPLVVRGPDAAGALIKHITFDRAQNKFNIQQRSELIGRLATTLDLPAEVLTGKSDLNHWSAWQVDDDSFRHHIEPMAVVEVDALTAGYMWLQLDTMKRWEPALVRKVLIWYDATALVTHPDRAADAKDVFDRGAIGRDSLRNFTGFDDSDQPDEIDALLYIINHARGVDPTILTPILKKVATSIDFPDVQPKGPNVIVDPATGQPIPPAAPAPEAGAPPAAPPNSSPDTNPGPPAPAGATARVDMWRRVATARSRVALVAAPAPPAIAEPASRKLLDIDRDLRARLKTAANAAVRAQLEKAGARIVSKARTADGAVVREAIKDVPKALIAATLGPKLVASLGLVHSDLADPAFAELEKQWNAWVADGQEQALRQAAKIAGVDVNTIYGKMLGIFKDDAAAGWAWLSTQMDKTVSKWLTTTPIDDIEVETTDFVGNSLVRAAMSIAGGFDAGRLTQEGIPADPTDRLNGIGGGSTISGFLDDNGVVVVSYTWVHGGVERPFPPHDSLDGTQFSAFDDEQLANDTGFPDGAYYYPGDHDGCQCDAYAVYGADASTGGDGGDDQAQGDDADAVAASQVVYRGLTDADQLVAGAVIVDRNFALCTTDKAIAATLGDNVIVMEVRCPAGFATRIADSTHEHLLPSGTRYQIVTRTGNRVVARAS